MNSKKIIEDCGAILDAKKTGEHYKYASGKHGEIYIEKRQLLKSPIIASQLANEITRKLWEYAPSETTEITHTFAGFFKSNITVFLGAVVSGAKFANYIALSYIDILVSLELINLHLINKQILCIEAEMDTLRYKTLVLKRNYNKDVKGKKIFIVEDVINSGATIMRLIELVVASGGEVVGIGCIWNRGDFNLKDIPLISLVNEKLESWDENDCPFCQKGIPLSKTYGHG